MKKKRTEKSRPPLRLEWIEAGSLADNPNNWRRHPAGQMSALKASLDDVGWAGALLFNETTGRLIDGHARKKVVDPKTPLPVLVGRWTPQQERQILVSLDPIGTMATTDTDALGRLMADLDFSGDGTEELNAVLDQLMGRVHEDADAGAVLEKKAVALERKYTEHPPAFTWVLIGVATCDFHKVSDSIEAIRRLGGTVKVSVSDADKQDR